MATRAPRSALSLLVVLVLAGACSTAGADPSSTGVASSSPDEVIASPSSCFNMRVEGQKAPQTTAMQASISPVILIGTYRGRGTAFWVTPNGTPPRNDQEAGRSTILTRVTIVTDTVVRGDAKQAIQAAIYGGSIDCSSLTANDPLSLINGERYLFFGTGPDPNDRPKGFVLVYEAWPVRADDTVETPTEGDQPLGHVLGEIAAYPLVEPGGELPFPTPDPSQPASSEDNGP